MLNSRKVRSLGILIQNSIQCLAPSSALSKKPPNRKIFLMYFTLFPHRVGKISPFPVFYRTCTLKSATPNSSFSRYLASLSLCPLLLPLALSPPPLYSSLQRDDSLIAPSLMRIAGSFKLSKYLSLEIIVVVDTKDEMISTAQEICRGIPPR